MRGSLDAPPIIVVTSRYKFLLLLATSGAFVAGGISMTRDGQTGGYGVACFFGLCAIVALWRLLVPARLELSPKQLLWFNGRKTLRFRWTDFQAFVPLHPARFSTHIGFILAPGSQVRTRMSDWNRKTFGLDGSLGGGWEIRPSDLIELLNGARQRWERSTD